MTNSNNDTSQVTAMMLFCTFLVLKLTEVIDWSWWYITMPLWGGILVVMLFAAVGTAILCIKEALDAN